jgi:hypothetical protein
MSNLTQNQRASGRKPLHTHGTLVMGSHTIAFTALDIGTTGVCLVVPSQLDIGKRYHIDLSLIVKGRQCDIAALAKVTYCVQCKEGFRVGMHFVDMINKANLAAIALYVESL